MDLTVEKGNVEYSFSFFYYNPSICDPSAGGNASDADEDLPVDRDDDAALSKRENGTTTDVDVAPHALLCHESL